MSNNEPLNYRELCTEVCEIAREAGEYIASQRETFTFGDVEFKGDQNMVSYVDKQTEKMVAARLGSLLPGAGFVTEEGMVHNSLGKRLKWVIDPLDGTTNFIHGLPPYCVSLALMEGDEVVVGVVYEVTLKEMFYAWKGSPAYLDGQEIKVSSTQKLENALVAVGFSYNTSAEVEDYLESIAYFQKNTNGIRRLGSAAADLAYVACGRFDAFFQVKLAAWDVAAGALIARAAGASVTDYQGGDDYIFGQEIVACPPALYDELIPRVR